MSDNQISKAHSIVGTSKGRPDDDFYPTPPEATRALLEREKFEGITWECAAGTGAICEVIREYGLPFIATDLHYRGYGDVKDSVDFLEQDMQVDNIITNPPYSLAQEFVTKALELTDKKVAMLLKLQFLEGQKRKEWFKNTPLKTVYVFSKRLQLTRNGEPMKNGGMICFSWFVWDKSYTGKPTIDWI